MQDMLIGQEVGQKSGKKSEDHAFSGEITLFSLWKEVLAEEDIRSLSECGTISKVRELLTKLE